MGAIDAVTSHYEKNEKQYIDIPEWSVDGVPLRIRWNLLSMERKRKLLSNEADQIEVLVDMAIDENGEQLFDKADKPKLRRKADTAIIARIVNAMLRITVLNTEDLEEAKKN